MNTNIFPILYQLKHSVTLWAAMLVIATAQIASAQNVVVLPGAANYSKSSSPQGAVRFQRGFYLITPAEMKSSNLPSSSVINSIGFTIGAAQNKKTKGGFNVYLQNTTDVVSRIDTNWRSFNVTTNSFDAKKLFPGNYEWQVKSNCTTSSSYSSTETFSNDRLQSCSDPSNFSTVNITDAAATFNWVAPASGAVKYYVEYKLQGALTWIGDTVTNLSYTASGLQPDKPYQWRVKTICSGSSSSFVTNNFTTNNTNACNPPATLTASNIANSSATFSWSGATGATYYSFQYRRKGTLPWLTSIAFSTTTNITALTSGTTYEWQVQTVCAAGKGIYIKGSDVTTTGTTQCYAPSNLSTDKLTDSSATLSWSATANATSYTVRYRLKNAILWNNAIAPMTQVHKDSITIPETIGSYNVPFKGGTAFTYNGNGVYVAWEYNNDSVLSSSNTSISTTANSSLKGIYGQDSIVYNLSFNSRLDTFQLSADTILITTNVRPETIFGTPSVKDNVDVAAVYALGNTSDLYSNPTPISALIKYLGSVDTTLAVKLTIKDQATGVERYLETVNTAFTAKSNRLVSFTGWSPKLLETDSLIVSVAGRADEEILNNNKNHYLQKVNRSIISFDDGSPALTSAGLDSLAGLTLIKQRINGCGNVNAAQIFLTPSAKGKAVYAVVLNEAKSIVATSSSFTPDSSQVNAYHSFYFPTPPAINNGDFYIGLAQQKGEGLLPVGVQWENGYTRTNSYFIDSINGGSLKEFASPGRLMIKAEIIAAGQVPVITGNLGLCAGTTTLTAVGKSTRFANSVIKFSSQNSSVIFSADQTLGTPNVFPNYATNPNAWLSKTPDDQREFLELGFSSAAPINYVDIYETLNPGAVDSIFVKDPISNSFISVYAAPTTVTPAEARINRITFPLTTFDVSEIRIALNSTAIAGYNSIDAVAIGQINESPAFASYNWMPGNLTTQTISVTTPGIYKVTVPTTAGCTGSDSVKTFVPVTVTPTISASKPSFCLGDSIYLKSSQVGGNTWSTGSTKDSIFVKTTTPVTVSYNDGSGCGITTSAPYTPVINALPIVTITGTLGICPGGTTTLDAGDYASYKWNTGATSRTISVTTPGTYTVSVVNASGCKGTGSAITTLSAKPLPVITGTLAFCPGGSTTLNAGASYSSYLWTNGLTTETNAVSTTGTVSVTVTNAAGCSGSASAIISMFAVPKPTITGANGICPAGSTTLTANSGYLSYLWSNPSAATTPSISATATGSYRVTVTDNNGCVGTSAAKMLIQFSNPTPAISGTLSFCGGNSTVLDAGFGYTSYKWSTGQTNRSIAVSTVGTYTVTVTDNNTCVGEASATTTSDNAIPATPGAISGPATGLCGGTYVYTIAPVINAAYYEWTVPTGILITSGQGTTSITVNVSSAFTSGNLIVAASNACGQSPSLNPRILALKAMPAAPGVINGPTSGVCGTTDRTYTISNVPSENTYTWTVPAGVTIKLGQGTTSIVVSFIASYTAGNICVKANSACGSSSTSCLAVAGIPSTPGPINGIVSVCSKQKNVSYSVPAVYGAKSYTWTVPAQASITSGQGTNSIIVSFGTKSGNVTVKANSTCGSSAIRSLATNMNCAGPVATSAMFDALEEESQVTKVVAYPNPTNGIVTLKIPYQLQSLQTQVKVFDAHGKSVFPRLSKLGANNIVLDLRQASKGLYLIKVLIGDKTNILKVILQ